MRLIGVAERGARADVQEEPGSRHFGKPVAERTVTQERIAEARIMIDSARLLVLKAAHLMDTVGNKAARGEIAMIKVLAPTSPARCSTGRSRSTAGRDVGRLPARLHVRALTPLRFADGPDEVHRNAIAKLELSRYIKR